MMATPPTPQTPLLSKTKSTRLTIQVAVIIELLLLTVCGLWWGLEHDSLMIPVRSLGGRSLLTSGVLLLADDDLPATQQHSATRRLQAHLIFQLEDGVEWNKWSTGLNQWMLDQDFHKWPCWKTAPSSQVILGGGASLSDQASKKEDNQKQTILLEKVEKLLMQQQSSRARDAPDLIEIVIYVPRVPSLAIADDFGQESTAMTVHKNRLVTIVQHDGSVDDSIAEAMSYLAPLLLADGPSLLTASQDIDLWLKQVVDSSYRKARVEAQSVRAWLLHRATNVPVTRAMAEKWFKTVERIASAEEGSLRQRIETLEMCIDDLEAIRKNATLMPPLVLQTDHFLAIFAPLLFPLLLPMMTRMVQECKRYKLTV